MKKYAKVVLAVVTVLVMVMAMTSCGESVKENALVMKTEQNGVELVMHFDAKGDQIVKISQVGTINLEGAPAGTEEQVKQALENAKAEYSKYDFVKYSYEIKDNKAVENISFPTSEEDVKKLKEANLLPVTGEGNKLSIKATKKNLEDAGWQEVKE